MTNVSIYRDPPRNMVAVWTLLFIFPLLVAAELAQRSNSLTHLPDQDSYRSNLSDQVLESSRWRQPVPESHDWRAPTSPKIEWRGGPTQESQQSVDLSNVELHPGYRPGESSTFDLSTREDKSLIKIFEFDFGR